jgi:dTDP-glucose 4,6-dehydratase
VGRLLGWRPQVRFAEGLAQTVTWYLDNRGWWEDVIQRGYAPVRIGVGA